MNETKLKQSLRKKKEKLANKRQISNIICIFCWFRCYSFCFCCVFSIIVLFVYYHCSSSLFLFSLIVLLHDFAVVIFLHSFTTIIFPFIAVILLLYHFPRSPSSSMFFYSIVLFLQNDSNGRCVIQAYT